MVNALSLRPLKWLAAPVKTLTPTFPRLNAASWDLQYRLGLWDYLDSERAGTELLRIVRKQAEQPAILDLGCGTGANLPLIPGAYQRYHGVDISAKAIERARALGRPNTSYETADILTYEPPGTYDVILLSEVLYYLPPARITGFLRRLSEFLTSGGAIVIQVWAGAENQRLTGAISRTRMHAATEQIPALDAGKTRTVYVLRADQRCLG